MSVVRTSRLIIQLLLLAVGLSCTSGCLVARVQWYEPDYAEPRNVAATSKRRHARAERIYARAVEHESKCLESCVDLFFEVARITAATDGKDCSSCRRHQLHRSALMKLVVAGQRFDRLDPSRGLVVHRDHGPESIPIDFNGFVWRPADFHHLTPVGEYKTGAIRRVHRCPGVGVPLVVTRCNRGGRGFLARRSVFAATLRLRDCQDVLPTQLDEPPRPDCRLELSDPLRVDEVIEGNCPKPLAKDLSAPLAYVLRDERSTYLSNFINSSAAGNQSRLYTLEPYQPRKIPVVLIHGLLSDPFTWVEVVNELQVHPGFVDHFQIWVFEYPTGQQFLGSAADLRKQLELARQSFDPVNEDPQIREMVLVGHSLGGLISKLQVTSSGQQLWRSVAARPMDQVWMRDDLRQEIRESFCFEPSPYVSRVIFMGAPHRGSSYATRLIGRVGSLCVSMPPDQRQRHRELIDRNPGVFSDEVSRRIPTSIDLLEPNSKLLGAIGALPVSRRVTLHSVIGDWCWRLGCGRSDGVVPVESAREPRAVSERIVRTRHVRVNKHPESIQELLFILQEHLQKLGPGNRW